MKTLNCSTPHDSKYAVLITTPSGITSVLGTFPAVMMAEQYKEMLSIPACKLEIVFLACPEAEVVEAEIKRLH